MKAKIIAALCIVSAVFSISASAYNTDDTTLYDNAVKFAQKYLYHEGDIEKSMSLYPDNFGVSGVETAPDGTQYELPAFYYDTHAVFSDNFDLNKGEMNIYVNGSESKYSGECVLYNSRTLVPSGIFNELGCTVKFDSELYVTTISNDEVSLEILPKMMSMRKNGENGYYVPLSAVARFVDDEIYIPVRAVLDEFGISVLWDGETNTVNIIE